MKPLALIAGILAGIMLAGCASVPAKPYPFTELAMHSGDLVRATTPIGTVIITANDELVRTYTWEGDSRSATLSPRPERWHGNLGAYYPGPGEHWRDHHGIRRGVLQDGQQHFQTEAEALAWIRLPWHQKNAVYRDDGLFVLFAKTLQRRQLTVDVIQIYIRGRKPRSLPGSQNSKIDLIRASHKATQQSGHAMRRASSSLRR